MDLPRPQQNNSTPSLALTGEGVVVSGSVSIPIADVAVRSLPWRRVRADR